MLCAGKEAVEKGAADRGARGTSEERRGAQRRSAGQDCSKGEAGGGPGEAAGARQVMTTLSHESAASPNARWRDWQTCTYDAVFLTGSCLLR